MSGVYKKAIVALIVLNTALIAGSSLFLSFDGDRTPLAKEVVKPTSPFTSDTDGDGLSDTYELTHRTAALETDTDRDGLNDHREVIVLGTDPTDSHTDRDGISDHREVTALETDPTRSDTDRDGLSDGREVSELETSPTNADSDGDSLRDGEERRQYETDPDSVDTDADGFTDETEIMRWTEPTEKPNCDPSENDTYSDADSLSDFEECRIGTDPDIEDTDMDGLDDGEEINGTTDDGVRIPNSNPLHRDAYAVVVETGDNTVDLSEVEEFFAQADVDNPSGRTGINVHFVVRSESDGVEFSNKSDYRKLRDEYEERYGSDRNGVYSVVLIGRKAGAEFSGQAELGGNFALVRGDRPYVFAHELLHTLLGEIDSSECPRGKDHICTQDGIMNDFIDPEDRKLSAKTGAYIESNEFSLRERGVET